MAGRSTTELLVKLVGDATDLKRSFSGAEQSVLSTSQKIKALGTSMQDFGKRMTLGVTVPIALAGRAAYNELKQSEQAAAQTRATLKSTGAVAGVTAQHVQDLATKLQNLSGTDDDVIHSGENLLLTFRHIRNEAGRGNDVFDRATKVMLDLSVALGQDMKSSAIQLGKALEDPIRGVTALRRAGVQMSEAQEAQIRKFVESGRLMEAQKVILKELETQVGGSAKAYGETLPGKIDRAKVALQNSAGLILAEAAPAFEVLAKGVEAVSAFISDLPGPLRAVVAGFAGIAAVVGPVLFIVGGMVKNFQALSEALKGTRIASVFSGIAKGAGSLLKVAGVVGVLVTIASALDSLFSGPSAVDKAFAAFRKQADGSARSLKELSAELRKLRSDSEHFGDFGFAATKFAGEIDNLHDRFTKLAQKSPDLARAFIEQARAAGFAKADIKALEATLAEQIGAQERASTAVSNAADQMINQGRAADLTAGQIDELRSAADELVNAQLGLSGAMLNVESSIKTYKDAVADSGASSFEARSAQQGLAESIEKAGQAAYDAALQQSTAKNSADKAREATQKQIDTLNFLKGALDPSSPLRKAIDDHIAALSRIPTKVGTKASLDLTEFELQLIYLRNKLAGVGASYAKPGLFTNAGGGSVLRFASGGVVPGPRGIARPAIVHGGEQILRPDQRRGDGGGSVTLQIIVPPTADKASIGREVVEAIKSYERSFGAGWRN